MTDDPIDPELEGRLDRAFKEMVPKLLRPALMAAAAASELSDFDDSEAEVLPLRRPPSGTRRRWLMPAVAAAGILLIAGIAVIAANRGPATTPSTDTPADTQPPITELPIDSTTPLVTLGPAFLPTPVPDGFVLWNIDQRGGNMYWSLRPATGGFTPSALTIDFAVLPSDDPLTADVLAFEQVPLAAGNTGYYNNSDTSQAMNWQTPDGYYALLIDGHQLLTKEQFVHLAQTVVATDAAGIDAARASIAQLIKTQLVSIDTGSVGGADLELYGIDATSPAALCVRADGTDRCQTAVGDVASVMAQTSPFSFFEFLNTDGSVDGYGRITPIVPGYEFTPGLVVETTDAATGTWIHVHKPAGMESGEIAIGAADEQSTGYTIGIT